MIRVLFINRAIDPKRLEWMKHQLPAYASKVEPFEFTKINSTSSRGYWLAGEKVVSVEFTNDARRSCSPGELSLTMTHLSTVIAHPSELFLYEDDVNLFKRSNPSILLSHQADPERLRPILHLGKKTRLPCTLQRIVKPYWLWPIMASDQCLVAFRASALTLRDGFRLKGSDLTFGEASESLARQLPLYRTTFGSSGTVVVWYSEEAVQRQREILSVDVDPTKVMPNLLKNFCPIDEVMNENGALTMWPPPYTALLPTSSLNSKKDLRDLPRDDYHLWTHLRSHKEWLVSNLNCQEWVREQMVPHLKNAWVVEEVCEAYFAALRSSFDRHLGYLWNGIALGVILWAGIELLVLIFKRVRL